MTDKANDRLDALRGAMTAAGVDGVLIPREDAFSGEEVRPCDERLGFISGFTGSAGMAVVLGDKAALFSDARYTIQMENETGGDWQCFTMPDMTPAKWLGENAGGKTIGFDPWLVTVARKKALEKALGRDVNLKPLQENPVDTIWHDRPPPLETAAFPYPEKYRGRNRGEKIRLCLDGMQGKEAMLISDAAALNWLLDIRGSDLATTPVLLAFGLLTDDGAVTVFTDESRFAGCDRENMAFAAPDEMAVVLGNYGADEIMLDPATCPVAIADMVSGALHAASPITALKAEKTQAELIAFRDAHKADAVAMAGFLHWFDDAVTGEITETEAIEKLDGFRAASPDFICPSFPAICGGGANGAVIHYRATGSVPIPVGSFCLVDSGGHYAGATTDITRTIATGKVTEKMRRAYTAVLKAHIALARARFAEDAPGAGATGAQLDGIARAPLWQAGMDYPHGTGHGVGACLSVHEGPAGITARSHEPIRAGMVLSNEPGFYVAGEYGIRIENLVAVVRDGDNENMLAFEQLTLVPIDLRPVESGLLDTTERNWLNAYHRRVRDEIFPLLKDDGVKAWLASATAEI